MCDGNTRLLVALRVIIEYRRASIAAGRGAGASVIQVCRPTQYATDTRKRQTCKGLRSTVNAIRTSDSGDRAKYRPTSEDSVKSYYRHDTDV